MAKATSTIVVREPNKAFPEAYITALLDQHPTAFGYASPQDGTRVDNATFDGSEYELGKSIKEIEAEYNKDRVFYFFLNANGVDLDEDSLQPFNLIVGEGKDPTAILSCVLEGEFKGYEDKEGYTAEYHVVNEVIKPLISELWDLCDKNIEKLMSALDKDSQKNKIKALMGERATILLIPCKGVAHAHSNVKDGGSFDWGFTTNTLGYSEGQKKAEAPAEKKELTMKEKKALRAQQQGGEEEKKGEEPKKEEAHPEGGSPISIREKFAPVLKSSSFVIRDGKLWWKPAGNWKQARTQWNTHCQDPRPEDAEKVYAGFPVDRLKPNSPIKDVINRLMSEGGKTAVSEQGPAQPDKKEEKPVIPAPREPAEMTLLITADEKAAWLKLKKEGKLTTVSKSKLKEQMTKYAAAHLQLGEADNVFDTLSVEAFAALPHHLAAVIFNAVRCNGIDFSQEEPEQPVKEKEGEQIDESKLSMKERKALRAQRNAA